MVISLTILLAAIGLCLFCFKDPIPSINIKNEEGFTLLFKPLNKLSIRLPNGTLLRGFEFNSIKKEFFRPYFNNRDLGHFVILLSDRIIVERRWFAEQQAFHVFPLTKKQYEKVYRHFQKLALR